MEDQDKINKILKSLNKGKLDGDWIEAKGNHALTVVEFDGKNANFMPGAGIPLKAFINTKTGEIKSYHANTVLRDSDE